MSMLYKSAIASVVLAALSGCAGTIPNTAHSVGTAPAASIAISVGPCFGFCPVYDAVIAADGTVSYTGTRHTAVLGARGRRAAPDTYRKLEADLAAFRPVTGSSAEISCAVEVSDLATYTITWTDKDGRKSIATHRGGCREGPGRDLDAVLRDLPMRLGIEEWMKQTTRPGVSRG